MTGLHRDPSIFYGMLNACNGIESCTHVNSLFEGTHVGISMPMSLEFVATVSDERGTNP